VDLNRPRTGSRIPGHRSSGRSSSISVSLRYSS
jgi:hypothetical protein